MPSTATEEKPPTNTDSPPTSNGEKPPLIYEHPDKVVRSPFNRQIDTKTPEFQELVASVKRHGVIEPLVARRVDNVIELIAGERRWRASKAGGLNAVPIVLRKATDAEVIELQTIENEKRLDLDPIEQAEKYQQAINQYGKEKPPVTGEKAIERLAAAVHKGKSTIYEALRLVKLPPKVKEAVANQELPASHAGLLLKLEGDPNAQERVLKAIRQPQSWEAEEFNGAKVLSFRNTKGIVEDEQRLAKARDKWRELAAAHKKKGGKVLGEDGKAFTYEQRQKHDYVSGSDYCYDYGRAGQPFEKLMGKHAPMSILAHDENWNPLKLYPKKGAKAAIEKNGHKKRSASKTTNAAGSRQTGSTGKTKATAAAQKEREQILNVRKEREASAVAEIVGKAEKMSGESSALYLWLIEQIWNVGGWANMSEIAKRAGIKVASRSIHRSSAVLQKLKNKSAKMLRGLTILALLNEIGEIYDGQTNWDPEFVSACKTFGVKVPEFKVELQKKDPPPDARKIKGLTAAGRKRLGKLMKARWTARQNAKAKARKR